MDGHLTERFPMESGHRRLGTQQGPKRNYLCGRLSFVPTGSPDCTHCPLSLSEVLKQLSQSLWL